MRISIEQVMLANFAIDALALWAALRPGTRLRPVRLLAAAATGAVFAAAAALSELSAPIRVCIALLLAPVMVRVASGHSGISRITGASAALLAVSAFIWAFARLLPLNIMASAAIAAALAAIVFGRRRRWLDRWDAEIYIAHNGGHSRFTALIDTGNRLIEPISGLPVMIVERKQLSSILPGDSVDLPRGFRMVAYGGVGGSGCLPCFMPDRMEAFAGGRGFRAPDIWVAVYDGTLPGSARALAPAGILRDQYIPTKRRMI